MRVSEVCYLINIKDICAGTCVLHHGIYRWSDHFNRLLRVPSDFLVYMT